MRIRIRTNGKTQVSTLVLMSYGFYVIWRIFYNSNIIIEYGLLFNLLSYAVEIWIICVSVLSIVVSKRFRTSEIFYEMLLLGIGVVVGTFSGYVQLFYVFLLVVSAKDIPFNKIVKTAFCAQLIAMVVVVGACAVGLLSDYIYDHWMTINGATQIHTAHTFGFTYYTTPAYIVLAMMLEWGYLNFSKVTVAKLGMWAVIQYVAYLLFTSRASFLMAIGYLVVLLALSKTNLLKIEKRLWQWAARLGFPVLLVSNYVLTAMYARNNELANVVNEQLSGRLYYAAEAISNYGIKLFGSKVPMVGNYEITWGLADTYFYIDSGYMYSLICYGVVVTILLMLAYSLVFVQASKNQDKATYCWLLVYMLMNMNNNMLTAAHYNPLLFLLPHVLQQISFVSIPVRISRRLR